jgi:choline dehydrogenase-like flavoprotein
MASSDYDVVIIGSGFGRSVAALRAAENGYRVGVMESGSVGRMKTFRRRSGICRTSCGCLPRSCMGSRGSSTAMMYSFSAEQVWAAARMCMPTRCMSRLSSSSMRGNGRASPIGPRSWRRISIRQRGCSGSFATRICLLTWTGFCSRLRSRWGEVRRSTRRRWVCNSGAPGSRPTIRTSVGWATAHRMHFVPQLQHRSRS